MLASVLWILIMGFFVGQIARRLGAPPLIGMILVGIIMSPQIFNLVSPEMLGAADDLRTLAVMIILMKAGLGLDKEKLVQQRGVALRLGFLPATTEAMAIALAAMVIFNFDFLTGLLLGCIISAESPAVIVPGMLRLKSLGWGVTKGIPDAILTGSALSDVLLLLVFSLLLSFLGGGGLKQIILFDRFTLTPWQLLPLQITVPIALGVVLGYLAARFLVLLLVKQNWTQNGVQDTVVAASIALFLVISAHGLPYFSGYLAAMSMGFFLIELDSPLARRLRGGFDSLWTVAEIFLFVLLGANIQLQVLAKIFLPGILILAIGLLIGRMVGWHLSTWGSNWNWRERLFLLPGMSAKATVQAAIGAIPLAQGIAGGEIILAIAALSILITAPLGAWGTMTFAPKLLTRGEVDPTKVTVATPTLLLAAIDTSILATAVLTKVADLARRTNAEVIVVHVVNLPNQPEIQKLKSQVQELLSDIRYKFITVTGAVPEEIIRTAQEHHATAIIMGKRGHQTWAKVVIGSVSQSVLEASLIPVILVENSVTNFG
ncbi:cation:proton antiporter [Umezakia ovalisporum]|uniref:Cation:proton antiporter n=2 Tax=Umezakia ovalisporum TaxID=75695 RepID=A0AA43KFL4_9CYAN|nr:cation:proton antiporter [Umezakia ovalisporum]MBI1241076.1 sodium:proton antiporter [Nostoc sp. RI_552]MDH6056560.1 cation:proton antiporter [Umezakia ovalisporum FSS-43]MDH6064078.1 cation:proton antiporter [Umezakia ovalisporum FSS-62]MDH6065800.1 cation:proton antiporter [Umezakia ovalisporum APH033B]MDH6069310.1 cation:proton antiporter [Umezakia ovalisporum CobakiLakeA]